jgi:Putative DNA-binding domain
VTLTEEDILARLTAIEDATVERKTSSDYRDWIKAAVAFSNSLENDQPGVLFIGVYNDGRIEEGRTQNFEKLQLRVSDELSNIYPPISPTILVRHKDKKTFLAVIVYGSPNRPHFAGKSYRRDGTQTVDASEEHLEQFVALRSSKVTEILKWKTKEITLTFLRPEVDWHRHGPVTHSGSGLLLDCNQFYITAKYKSGSAGELTSSHPLSRVEISFDNRNGRLELNVLPS